MAEPGVRDELLTRRLARELERLEDGRVLREALDDAEAPGRLARHLARAIERLLAGSSEQVGQLAAQLNALLAAAKADEGDGVVTPPEILTEILAAPGAARAPRPKTAFSVSDLLVNAEGQPNIGAELRHELASAARVDLICAFVIWTVVNAIREPLRGVIDRGGTVRVITTTYMGATQRRAVDELVRLGADVRVAFDARTTKLHAKAWLMERPAGMTTAFVGSSNLSHTALFDGLEWNVRVAQADAPHIIDRVRMMFDAHWESGQFEDYDPAARGDELDRALGTHGDRDEGISFAGLEVKPWPYQERMLDELAIERHRHGRHRNLVVAATGTGKTVLAALDYRRLCAQDGGTPRSLLFVAHRDEILQQARSTFRHVMRDGSFGEIHGGGQAAAGRHVFAMIQSLRPDTIAEFAPDAFDVVIVDEFHHAAAPTYRALLDHLRPGELLGLTATPERMDGQDVTEWFGGRIAVELRLWEAIDRGHLVPFQYFGVADDVDLSSLTWRRGGYLVSELERIYTGDDARVAKVLEAVRRIVLDPQRMRALGFCVSVDHARYMARTFNQAGLASASIDGTTPRDERAGILRRLAQGELRVVFSVDVLGEGVDVPAVDTVLLLRPTQSATVLTQQIGRGLRHADGKASLTVIDLIGQQHRRFRFEDRLRALVDVRRGAVQRQVEDDFPFLPSGCHIELDRVSREIILDNLREGARLSRWSRLVEELHAMAADITLDDFLAETGRAPRAVYAANGRSWTALCRDAGRAVPAAPRGGADEEEALLRAVRRWLHVDDPERVDFYGELLAGGRAPRARAMNVRQQRLATMLLWGLFGLKRPFGDLDAGLRALWRHQAVVEELRELLAALDARSETLPAPSSLDPATPLAVHARYSQPEILAAYGLGTPDRPPVPSREGVRYIEPAKTDVLFVTLHKAEREYSPTTMYRDYAVSRERFHWESQSIQSQTSPSVRRYIEHAVRGTHVHLFLRERKAEHGVASPYLFAGPLAYEQHEGDRPVAFTWRLQHALPEVVFEAARSVAV
ncbi:DUF3427 domain-containing protein [Svornostia abyssi]|uniref:DUF3427 domain-containing protein n=1 Tax=Svornostia abyssi TaxID=2898438 RepID=A0ABY5PHC4_9ACTN|nr:DUF3427 domain-containing protein [Parviterribacteraceae bacterium J379]